MKRSILILICCLGCLTYIIAQEVTLPLPWNTTTKLNSYRPLQTMPGSSREFIDQVGDKTTDFTFSLKELGISDATEVIKINTMQYADFYKLDKTVSEKTWKNALEFVQIAEKQGINTQWYALLKSPKSIRQQYSFGYWLKFYLFMDMMEKANKEQNKEFATSIVRTYFGQKN